MRSGSYGRPTSGRRHHGAAQRRADALRASRPDAIDVKSPEFIAEARRQSLAVAQSPGSAEDQAFIDSVSIIWDLKD